MKPEIVITRADNLLQYTNKVVRIVPKVLPIKIQFKLNSKKGCGRVVGTESN